MSTFCNDTDLLLWEPNLLAEAALASQTLISGTADLVNTTLTIAAGDLLAAHVTADQVVVLAGTISGCFPIVSVDSSTTLTISILYEGTWPGDTAQTPSRIGSAVSLSYTVRSFYPQRRLVADLLRRAVGIDTRAGQAMPAILNPEVLRRANALGTLQMIHSALAAAADAPEVHQARADLYQRMYRRELRSCAVQLDLDGDSRVDTIRRPGILTFSRG